MATLYSNYLASLNRGPQLPPNPSAGVSRGYVGGRAVAGPGLGTYGSRDVYRPSNVLGAQAPGPSTGNPNPNPIASPSGGGAPQGGQPDFSGAQIPQPQQFTPDYDALIAPALQAYDQAMAPQQTAYDAQVADINAGKTQQAGQINNALTEQQNVLSAQRNTQQTQAQNAIDEARRGYSEIQQGLQSRYGGTTGTGAFAAEMAGAQTQRGVGQIQNNLMNALKSIDDTSLRVKQVHDSALQDLETSTQARIQQAKSTLESNLNQIRMAKGELQGRKAELAYNAMQHYQDTVNQVNAANATFKQNMVLEQQRIQAVLDQYRQSGANYLGTTLKNLGGNTWSLGQTQTPVGSTGQPANQDMSQGTNTLLPGFTQYNKLPWQTGL